MDMSHIGTQVFSADSKNQIITDAPKDNQGNGEPAKTFIIFERLITESFWFEFDFIDQLVEIDPLYY